MGRIKKLLSVFGLSVVLLAGMPTAPAQAAAWSCPSGYLCVWDGLGGTGGRCLWLNRDDDWQRGSSICPWTINYEYPVRSVYNRGTSTAYDAVMLFGSAGYVNLEFVIGQGEKRDGLIRAYLRSHRWRTA